MAQVTERFSNRVENYEKYRPHYPDELIGYLLQNNITQPGAIIADIGSGTGISSRLFLKNGFIVYAVEPNTQMRNAAESSTKQFVAENKMYSVNATAENTLLANNSVDTIVVAQAFHWFKKDAFKTECKRILKPRGYVALIWNDRRTDTNLFLKEYEQFLIKYSTDYLQVNHKNTQDNNIFDAFFGKNNYKEYSIYNFQDVDFDGLKGRVLSSSYMPDETAGNYPEMLNSLKTLFEKHQKNNMVRLDYDTKIYTGTIH